MLCYSFVIRDWNNVTTLAWCVFNNANLVLAQDVGMSDTALRKLTDITCDLLETMIQVAYSKGTLVRNISLVLLAFFLC